VCYRIFIDALCQLSLNECVMPGRSQSRIPRHRLFAASEPGSDLPLFDLEIRPPLDDCSTTAGHHTKLTTNLLPFEDNRLGLLSILLFASVL